MPGVILSNKQAGAELCQAQVKLEVVVEIGVKFGVEVEACLVNFVLHVLPNFWKIMRPRRGIKRTFCMSAGTAPVNNSFP